MATGNNSRLSALFDDGLYTEINERVKEKESETTVVTAYGYVNAKMVYAFSQENLSVGLGEKGAAKIAKIYEIAAKTGNPIVGIFNSNGAYVDGSMDSVLAYGKILKETSVISGVVPQISVIVGPCIGTAAIVANSADIVIMTKNAEFYYSPVFDEKEKKGAGTAQTAYKNGTVAIVADDEESALSEVRQILDCLPQNNLDSALFKNIGETPAFDAKNILGSIADTDSVLKLYDGYGKNASTALARIDGETVGIIDVKGALCSHVSKKISRFVRLMDAFNIPIITLIDTEGFPNDINAEIGGALKTMTVLSNSYSEATTAKISVITGNAIGAGFTALTNTADFIYAWENAVITPVKPDTFVEFSKKEELKFALDVKVSRQELAFEYAKNSTLSAAQHGAVDSLIAPEDTRPVIINALAVLEGKREHKLPKKHNNLPI